MSRGECVGAVVHTDMLCWRGMRAVLLLGTLHQRSHGIPHPQGWPCSSTSPEMQQTVFLRRLSSKLGWACSMASKVCSGGGHAGSPCGLPWHHRCSQTAATLVATLSLGRLHWRPGRADGSLPGLPAAKGQCCSAYSCCLALPPAPPLHHQTAVPPPIARAHLSAHHAPTNSQSTSLPSTLPARLMP